MSGTGLLVLVGQAGSDPPPPHTPGAVTVTVQVWSPAEESVKGDMVAVLVRVEPEAVSTDTPPNP